MTVTAYQPGDAAEWDRFVAAQAQATVLHARRFLDYHGDRFLERSALIRDESGALIGLFPAASLPGQDGVVTSHPGATYGGLITRPGLAPARMVEMLAGLRAFYAGQGATELCLRQPPGHIAPQRQEAMDWALWQVGARPVRRDLWNIVELGVRPYRAKGHKWAGKKARTTALSLRRGTGGGDLAAFHALLVDNLASRHGAAPVHDVAELCDLEARLGADFRLLLAEEAGVLAGGILVFRLNAHVWHTQYIAASAAGREKWGLNLMIEALLEQAAEAGAGVLSFGASTQDGGAVLNDGLYAFKAGFGKSSAVQEIYTLKVEPPTST